MTELKSLLKPLTFASKVFQSRGNKCSKLVFNISRISARKSAPVEVVPVSPEDGPKIEEHLQRLRGAQPLGDTSNGIWSKPTVKRKTKIVCTMGPSTGTKEMIWKLVEAGMNVARLNMSHSGHASHQKVIDMVKEYNAQSEKDWDDVRFGVDNKVDFYVVPFVKDAEVVHELRSYWKSCDVDIHVIVKIESADSILNLHSIITTSDGSMVTRRDFGAELPIEEVPLLQEEIINSCLSMVNSPRMKTSIALAANGFVLVVTNMLESMIVHPTPTRAEVSDIATAVREGSDGIMLSGEIAHGQFSLKAARGTITAKLQTAILSSIEFHRRRLR